MIESGAHISGDGLYRYGLWRRWGVGDEISFVMLNPSTADGTVDDPTIRRCIGFSKGFGFDGLTVVNLYALRATKPFQLRIANDPHGPENNGWLSGRLASGGTVVCAWGSWTPDDWTVPAFQNLAKEHRALLWCLGRTKNGSPRHPLYLKGDSQLEVWP